MPRTRRSELTAEARRVNTEQMARAGWDVRTSRRRRKLTQRRLAELAGVGRTTVGRMEAGRGAGVSVDSWQRVAIALGRRMRLSFDRDTLDEPADAGHLVIQDLLLRLGRAHGYARTFELPTKPADPTHSVDVGWRADHRRFLVLLEAVNIVKDIGAAARSSARKVAQAEDLASALWGTGPHLVTGCWVVRATKRNRALVARYPDVFASRFPASSVAWARAVTEGSAPPKEPGLVWCDVAATRIFPWRQRR